MSSSFPFELAYKPKLSNKTDYGIAFIGTGGVVQYAHIPAYKKQASIWSVVMISIMKRLKKWLPNIIFLTSTKH